MCVALSSTWPSIPSLVELSSNAFRSLGMIARPALRIIRTPNYFAPSPALRRVSQERDFVGYGQTQPRIGWPDGATRALTLVVNYEAN